MKKAVAIIAVAVILTATLCINTFAWESGEKASLWANGLNHIYDSGQSAGAFGAIYGQISDNRIKGIYNFAQTTLDDVYYEISLKEDFNYIGPRSDNTEIYILYETNRNVYADYEITSGSDVINNVKVTNTTIPEIQYRAFAKSLGQNIEYNYNLYDYYKAIKIEIDYSNDGDARIRINMHFTNTDVQQYIREYDDVWSAIRGAINSGNIEVVGRYIRTIVNVTWINQLFVLGIVAVIISLAYNWLRSL